MGCAVCCLAWFVGEKLALVLELLYRLKYSARPPLPMGGKRDVTPHPLPAYSNHLGDASVCQNTHHAQAFTVGEVGNETMQ